MIRILIILSLILAPQLSHAKKKRGKRRKLDPIVLAPPNPLMQKFLQNMTELQPYIISEEEFAKVDNEKKIKMHLGELSKISSEVVHEKSLSSPGYKISKKILEDHVQDTENLFRSGNKAFARIKLSATYSICVTCHTQLPVTSQRRYPMYKASSAWSKEKDQAEFLFITRQFDEALTLFDKLINSYPDNGLKPEDVERAMDRKLAIYTRILHEPQQAIDSIKKNLTNTKLPPFVVNKAQAWLKGFEEWKKEEPFVIESATSAKIQNHITQLIKKAQSADADLRTLYYLRISGTLYEHLNYSPNQEMVPQILLWLGMANRYLDRNLFFSLGELYLQECMQQFSTSPAAKKCFEEYEDQITASYSGSNGTHIPEEVQKELEKLRQKVGLDKTDNQKAVEPTPTPVVNKHD